MKEIHKFVADDGTEFDSYYECKNYERHMLYSRFVEPLGNDLLFYDYHRAPTKYYERARYIIARTEAAKNVVDELATELNIETPWDDCPSTREYNAWYWDENFDEWRSYEELKERQEELTLMLTAFDFWLNKQDTEEK